MEAASGRNSRAIAGFFMPDTAVMGAVNMHAASLAYKINFFGYMIRCYPDLLLLSPGLIFPFHFQFFLQCSLFQ